MIIIKIYYLYNFKNNNYIFIYFLIIKIIYNKVLSILNLFKRLNISKKLILLGTK